MTIIHQSCVMPLLPTIPDFTVALSVTGVNATSTEDTCHAGIRFQEDGRIMKRAGGSTSNYTYTGSNNWGTPTEVGQGVNYWVRCDITAGVLGGGTTGSWISIATEPAWTNSDTTISASTWQEGTVTFQVSSSPTGTPVLSTITNILIKANRIP